MKKTAICHELTNLTQERVERKLELFRKRFKKFFLTKLEEYKEKSLGTIRAEAGFKTRTSTNIANLSGSVLGTGLAFIPGIGFVVGPFVALGVQLISGFVEAGGAIINKAKAKLLTTRATFIVEATIEEIAFEIARVYEYQIAMLELDIDIEKLATGAVFRIMSYGKDNKNEKLFDSNTLLEALIRGQSAHEKKIVRKKTLNTLLDPWLAANNMELWTIRGVFEAPGLRLETHDQSKEGYSYHVLTNLTNEVVSKIQKYGFRGCFRKFDKQGNRFTPFSEIDPYSAAPLTLEELPKTHLYFPSYRLVTKIDMTGFSDALNDWRVVGDYQVKRISLRDWVSQKYLSEGSYDKGIRYSPVYRDVLDVSNLDFSWGDLSRSDMCRVFLNNSDNVKVIECLKLRRTRLMFARAKHVHFDKGDLQESIFICANLEKSGLGSANLTHMDVYGADLTKAGVENNTTFHSARNLDKAILDDISQDPCIIQRSAARISDLELELARLRSVVYPVNKERYHLLPRSLPDYQPRFSLEENINAKLILYRMLSISGAPGTGKTESAYHYLFSAAKRNDYLVISYFDAESEELLVRGFLDLARNLKVYKADENDEKNIRDLHEKLEGLTFLLLFDNADIIPYNVLSKYLPSCNRDYQNIMITTRNEELLPHVELRLTIEGFSQNEGIAYLQRGLDVSQEENSAEEAVKLAEKYSYLPLGLAVAKRILQLGESIASYNREFEESAHNPKIAQLEVQLLQHYRSTQHNGAKQVFALYKDIFNSFSDGTKQLLKLICFVHNTNVPLAFLLNSEKNIDINLFVFEIQKYSFGTVFGVDDNRCITLHKVANTIIEESITEDSRAEMINIVAERLLKYFKRDSRYRKTFKNDIRLMKHVEVFLEKFKGTINPIYQVHLEFVLGYFYTQISLIGRAENVLHSALSSLVQFAQLDEKEQQDMPTVYSKLKSLNIEYPQIFKTTLDSKCRSLYPVELYVGILYTLGRTHFYQKYRTDEEARKPYVNFLNICKAVSEYVTKEFGISFLDKMLVERNGLLYLPINIPELDTVNAAQKRYEDLLKDDTEYFEMGNKLNRMSADEYHVYICCKQILTCIQVRTKLSGAPAAADLLPEIQRYIHKLDALSKEDTEMVRVGEHFNIVGNYKLHRKETDEAMEYFNKAIAAEIRIYGDEDALSYPLANAFLGLAKCHLDKKEFDKASTNIKKCLNIMNKIYEPTDPRLKEATDLQKTINHHKLPTVGKMVGRTFTGKLGELTADSKETIKKGDVAAFKK